MAILPKMKRRVAKLKSTTSRQFIGGLNVVDSELNISSKFAVILDNMMRGIDGAITVKQGTKKLVDLTSISTGIQINGRYFNGRIVSVNSTGEVFTTDSFGVGTRVWDSVIAGARRSGLRTWGLTKVAVFEEMGGELIIGNGVDKPLLVNSTFTVDYLADKPTGSNLNVPIGKVMCKYNKHLVIANGSLLNVSDENASGTYTGDAGATYAGQFDLRSSVESGSTTIIGLSPFRDWLLVHFKECTVPIQFTKVPPTPGPASLQLTDSSDSGGTLNILGAISHRSIQNIGDSSLACDIVGVASIALATFTTKLSPDRPSRLVDPLIQSKLADLDSITLENNVFSQYDRLNSTYLLFTPDTVVDNQVETHGFGYQYIDKLNIEAWNTYSNWNWAWSTRSSEGLIFFGRAKSNTIFTFGDVKKLPQYADYIGDQETFSDGTVFTDGLGLSPVSDVSTSGVPIRGVWELPWSDLKQRGIQKTTRYIIIDAEGSSRFTMKMFIDDKYEDPNDMGEAFSDGTLFYDNLGFIRDEFDSAALTPAQTIEFVASGYGGYGAEPYGDIYGGGRNTKFRRLIPMPAKFTTFKLRFEAETMRSLKIVGITPSWIEGSIRRNSDV